jgi:hypothetical protein
MRDLRNLLQKTTKTRMLARKTGRMARFFTVTELFRLAFRIANNPANGGSRNLTRAVENDAEWRYV